MNFVPYTTSILSHGLHKGLGKDKRKMDHLYQREMLVNHRHVQYGTRCAIRKYLSSKLLLSLPKVIGDNSWQVEPQGNNMAYFQETNNNKNEIKKIKFLAIAMEISLPCIST